MNPHTNYLAVGLFLFFGLIGTVVLVMWLGRAGEDAPMEQFVVEVVGGVNGLSNGSTVRYLGVNVGFVKQIKLHSETSPTVEVDIEINSGLPIDDTTYATLVVQGVTGIANLDLANDPNLARPQQMHASGVPIIPFRASGLSAILAGSGDITTEVRRLLARLNSWAGEENRMRVEGILADVRELTSALAEQREDIPLMIGSLKSAIASLERTAGRLETAVAEDWPLIAADLRSTSSNLASVSQRVDGWLASNDESVDRLLGKGLDSASALVVDLRNVADQLARLSARLREDPSRIIYRAQHDPVVADP